VGSVVTVWNLLASIKSVILESYCFMGRITGEFPLSARVTMFSFSLSFVFMLLTIFASGCVLCVCWGLFSFIRVLIRSAVQYASIEWQGVHGKLILGQFKRSGMAGCRLQ